jgi:hypothetical protein
MSELHDTALSLLDLAEKRAFEPMPAGQPMPDPNQQAMAAGQPGMPPDAAMTAAGAGSNMPPDMSMAEGGVPAGPPQGAPEGGGAPSVDLDTVVQAFRQVMQEAGGGGNGGGGEKKKSGGKGEVEERLAALEAAVSGLGQYLKLLTAPAGGEAGAEAGAGGEPAPQGFSGGPASPTESQAAMSAAEGMAPLDQMGGGGMQVAAGLKAKKIGRLVSTLRK